MSARRGSPAPSLSARPVRSRAAPRRRRSTACDSRRRRAPIEPSDDGDDRATSHDRAAPIDLDHLPRPHGFEDDRDDIEPGDRVVLIIENEPNFAKILLDMAREKGFKGLVALDGDAGLQLAHAFHPDAITLDIDMPGIDGWAVLDRLKHHPETRHIPVHIITGIRERQQGLKAGAIAYLEKPVSKEALEDSFNKIATFIDQQVKRLLVVEDDDDAAPEHGRADRARGRRDHRGRRRRTKRSSELKDDALRLHGARPRARRRHRRLRAARDGEGRSGDAGPADHHLHRQGAEPGRRRRGSGSSPRRSSSRT